MSATTTSRARALHAAHYGSTATFTLKEAEDAFWTQFRAAGTVPMHALDATRDNITNLHFHTARLELHTIGDLVANATTVLTAVAGVTDLRAGKTSKQTDALHTARNTLLALATAAALSICADPTPIYEAVPRLSVRTRHLRRPLTDDEIVLCRLHALHLLNAGPHGRRNACTYALAEAGIAPTEITLIRASHFTSGETELHVSVPANRSLAPRTITLDHFHTTVLEPRRAELGELQEDALLTYRSRKNQPGSDQAAASVHGVINRFLLPLGIGGTDLAASCIYLWRLHRVLMDQGTNAASQLSGLAGNSGQQHILKLVGNFVPRADAPTAGPFATGFLAA